MFHRRRHDDKPAAEKPGRGRRTGRGPFCYSGLGSSAEVQLGVDPELLAILACPDCKTPVVPVHEGCRPEVRAGVAVCYPIKDDIPVMLIDEATTEPVTTDSFTTDS